MEQQIDIKDFISDFSHYFETERDRLLWEVISNLKEFYVLLARTLKYQTE